MKNDDIVVVDGITLTPYAIAIIKNKNIGVISDLHIGMEELSLLTSRLQTAEMLKTTLYCIEKYELKKLVIAGDIKQGFGKNVIQEWEEIKQFFEFIREKVDIILIKGNHDFYIKNIIKDLDDIKEHDFYKIENYIISHGHKKILRGNETLIIGNEHPAITIRDEVGARVKLRAYLWAEKEKLLVLPSFNPLTKGTNVLSANDWLSDEMKNIDTDAMKIYAIEEDSIFYFGSVRDLKILFK
ncbi:MAG: metallophosphoesterase [Candidatus Anstonellales archaeon]